MANSLSLTKNDLVTGLSRKMSILHGHGHAIHRLELNKTDFL